jgi:hypothetical protein
MTRDRSSITYAFKVPAFLALLIILAACGGSAGDAAHTALYTVAVDDGSLTRLLSDPELAYWGAAWSPDGTTIVFGSERGGAWGIYTMREERLDPADGHRHPPGVKAWIKTRWRDT